MKQQNDVIRQNSLRAWLLAARPKTLSGAAVPVLIGAGLAVADAGREVNGLALLLCLLFAFVMQIDANLVNDYFDFRHGNDAMDRLGPPRACTEGWITPRAMLVGILLTTLAGCLVGLPLIFFGGLTAVVVGVLCVLFCFLYTTHLSYLGLGDVLVLLFFGLVPVTMTRFVALPAAMQDFSLESIVYGLACGLVVDTLLIVNNTRDIDNDIKAGKRTLIVMTGRKGGVLLYWLLPALAVMMMLSVGFLRPSFLIVPALLLVSYCLLHRKAALAIREMRTAAEADKVLAATARNMFVFGLVTAIGLLLSTLLFF